MMGHYEDYWTRDDFVADADAELAELRAEVARLTAEAAKYRHGLVFIAYGQNPLNPLTGAQSARIAAGLLPATAPTRPADADPDISGVPV